MRILIENYRGFEINFEPENERFTFCIDESNWSEKQSYAACKRAIDEYLKENNDFKPFKIINISTGKVFDVVGIRKDKKFVLENKQVISGYNECSYLLYEEKFDSIFVEIYALSNQISELQSKISKKRELLIGTRLNEIRNKYTNQ